jgi:hypothetical protein
MADSNDRPKRWRNVSTDSLGEKLRRIAESLPSDTVTMSVLRAHFGPDGLLLLAIFLALIFMVPVQIPGVGVAFGFAIAMIGVSRLRGRPLWLPRRFSARTLSADKVRSALAKGLFWVSRLERVSRPHRLQGLVTSPVPSIVNDIGLICGGVLLMAPVILIPFSNTLPALGVLFLAIGMLQKDGVCVLCGHFANIFTVVYFVVLAVGGHALFGGWLFRSG